LDCLVALFELEATVLTYLIGFIAIDFLWVLGHRLSHQINFLWNKHAIHHSSEEFILRVVCANRFQVCQSFLLLLIPAALLGVP
jgi:sterol desaturase/sphingolipid hydroxylase (fatty acid hydroxylase superfamily)